LVPNLKCYRWVRFPNLGEQASIAPDTYKMLSVLIVNWNTRDLLRDCLQSIREASCTGEIEVIVVDNASSDESAKMVRAEFPEVLLHASETNLGYAAGNNAALALSQGELLLTLNPDTVLEPDSLSLAITALQSDPKAGCLSGQLIGANGETQASIRGFPSMIGILGDLIGMAKRLPNSAFDSYRRRGFDYSKPAQVEQPMGTFLMFRKEALQSVGVLKSAFDEAFPIFFNEVDLLYRLKRAGWYAIYEPKVRVRHLGGASTKQVRKPMIWESHLSLIRYMKKHWLTWWNSPVYALFVLFVVAGAFIRARGFHAGFRA